METAMPTRRFEQIALAQLLIVGCAVAFSACALIEHAQAQPGYVPPPTPLPPPVLNPSNPGTVPQPSYTPIAPSTPSAVPGYEITSPVNEGLPRTAARSYRYHHRVRAIPVIYHCGYLGCVRLYSWAFPCQYYSAYCYPYGYYQRYGWYGY